MKFFFLLISLSTFANAQTEFKGTLKGSSLPCSLNIQQVYYANNVQRPENLRLDVVAVVEDEHHLIAHGEELFFTVGPGARQDILSGVGSNGKDQINIIRKTPSLESIDSYAVKWLHTNHFHSAQCVGLKRVN